MSDLYNLKTSNANMWSFINAYNKEIISFYEYLKSFTKRFQKYMSQFNTHIKCALPYYNEKTNQFFFFLKTYFIKLRFPTYFSSIFLDDYKNSLDLKFDKYGIFLLDFYENKTKIYLNEILNQDDFITLTIVRDNYDLKQVISDYDILKYSCLPEILLFKSSILNLSYLKNGEEDIKRDYKSLITMMSIINKIDEEIKNDV